MKGFLDRREALARASLGSMPRPVYWVQSLPKRPMENPNLREWALDRILIICGASWTGTPSSKALTSQVLVPRRDGEYKSSTECEIGPDISDWRSPFSLPVSHRYPQMNKGLRSLLCCPVWIGGLGSDENRFGKADIVFSAANRIF